MGRKCSTVYDGVTCRSGYKGHEGTYRVIAFPADINERKRWISTLPNVLKAEDVTNNMGICLRHWKKDFEYRIGPGGFPRPLHPPSEFGTTPASFGLQSPSHHRRTEERGVTAGQRSRVNTAAKDVENPDVINSYGDLCTFCKDLPYPTEITEDQITLLKVAKSTLFVEFLIRITSDFKISAYRGSKIINIRDLIDSFKCVVTLYSQVHEVITRLSSCPNDIRADMAHAGEHFTDLVEQSDLEDSFRTKIRFLCTQMVLSEFKSQGHRYDASSIRDFIEIFLCSRSAYKKLRKYLQLPSNNTLKSYFGKLGSAGSSRGVRDCREKRIFTS